MRIKELTIAMLLLVSYRGYELRDGGSGWRIFSSGRPVSTSGFHSLETAKRFIDWMEGHGHV